MVRHLSNPFSRRIAQWFNNSPYFFLQDGEEYVRKRIRKLVEVSVKLNRFQLSGESNQAITLILVLVRLLWFEIGQVVYC